MTANRFEPGDEVEVSRAFGADTVKGEVFVQDGTAVAIELGDGTRAIYHKNKVDRR